MVRVELTAEDSLAAMRARNRFGIAIAAIIRIMATTIKSSINEKPFCLSQKRFILSRSSGFSLIFLDRLLSDNLQSEHHSAIRAKCASIVGLLHSFGQGMEEGCLRHRHVSRK